LITDAPQARFPVDVSSAAGVEIARLETNGDKPSISILQLQTRARYLFVGRLSTVISWLFYVANSATKNLK
jgi:hypothetical protein